MLREEAGPMTGEVVVLHVEVVAEAMGVDDRTEGC